VYKARLARSALPLVQPLAHLLLDGLTKCEWMPVVQKAGLQLICHICDTRTNKSFQFLTAELFEKHDEWYHTDEELRERDYDDVGSKLPADLDLVSLRQQIMSANIQKTIDQCDAVTHISLPRAWKNPANRKFSVGYGFLQCTSEEKVQDVARLGFKGCKVFRFLKGVELDLDSSVVGDHFRSARRPHCWRL